MAVVLKSAWPRAAAIVGKGTPAVTAATPKEWRRPRGQAWGPSMLAARMRADTWRPAPGALAGDGPKAVLSPLGARLVASDAVHQVEGVHQVLGDRYGAPVLTPAFECRDPDLVGLEVDVACSDGEGLGDPAPGEHEGAREGLHGGGGVRADRGEESLAFVGGGAVTQAMKTFLEKERKVLIGQ